MKYIFLLLLPFSVLAGEHHNSNTVNNYNSYKVESQNGIALSIASGQHSFDASTYKSQISISSGAYQGNTAFSIAGAKRACKDCPLISGSISSDGDNVGYGASLGFRF